MIILYIIIAVWIVTGLALNYNDDVARQRYYDELRYEKLDTKTPKKEKYVSPRSKIRWID